MKNIFLGVFIFLFLVGCGRNNFEYEEKNIYLNDKIIKVQIADTPEKSYNGLSFRESLCQNCGMLFAFENKSKRSFVMRNMKIPLDIIFIEDNKVSKIYKNLPPEDDKPKNIYSANNINYVLEVNGGFTDSNKIKERDGFQIIN